MPLYRRVPKRGFSNAPFKNLIYTVDIAVLEKLFDAKQEITREELVKRRLVNIRKSRATGLIKLLGSSEMTKQFIIHADLCSEAARAAIEKVGGEVRLTREG
jgi:large subunit ribosomal protein L15